MNCKVKIAVCNHRTDKKYKNQELDWDYLVDRNKHPLRTSETAEEYPKMTKDQRSNLKDIGGVVGGWLRGGIRKNGNVLFRTLGLLDADSIPAEVDFCNEVKTAYGNVTYFIYSTHSHTAQTPRYRVVFLFSREVSEEEYPALMRMAAKQIGMDYFDDSTYQANRMMYWASCPSNGEFAFEENQAQPLDVDALLSMYEDWHDISQWPTSTRQSEVIKTAVGKQQNPLEKAGTVGVFCRAFPTIQETIEEFLSDIYTPTADGSGRYDFIPGEGSAGVVIYDDLFAYSHHATDPACEKLLNGFDLVRIHKFGDLDAKKSFNAMCELALSLDKVKLQLAAERKEKVDKDFEGSENWESLLKYMPRSNLLENSVWNEMLILNNDPDYANFAFNEMANRVQITGPLPWDRPKDNKFWRDADTAQMKALIDIRYIPFSSRNHEVSFTKVADDRSFHPVRDYLNSLPEWDGKKRVENLLIRYLQADNTDYVKTVTRKTFAAAVARIYHPGVKYDCVLVLDGIQGIGKSTLFKDLVGDEYYSETLSLTDMNDKSGAEKLQGFWIMEIAELAGMKKADIEKVKAFLSTSDDKYRPSYGKTVESHPRQCIIIASVNGERGYLRDITGNRRFWVVKLNQTEQKKTWNFTKEDRDQIWAESKYYYENGEKLYLEGDMISRAEEVQREAMEVDERQGMVEEYLEMLLPLSWESMDIYARKNYLTERDAPTTEKGITRRNTVSNAEIWCECFGRSLADLKPSDSYAIAALMTQIDGWQRTSKVRKCSPYGKQRLYERTCCFAQNTDN